MPESTDQMQPGVRERTYSWGDPAPALRALSTMSGLAMLEAIGAGSLPRPPVMATVGITLVVAEAGRVVFDLEPAVWHLNPLGTVHGGVLATLLDTCTGCALHSTLPAGTGYTTVDLSVKFLRPVTEATGAVTAEGTVVFAGRRTALTEARAFDGQHRLLAHATSTCLILERDG